MNKPNPAYAGDGPFVFVSYAHADSAEVYSEIAWFQAQGFDVWWDEGYRPSHPRLVIKSSDGAMRPQYGLSETVSTSLHKRAIALNAIVCCMERIRVVERQHLAQFRVALELTWREVFFTPQV